MKIAVDYDFRTAADAHKLIRLSHLAIKCGGRATEGFNLGRGHVTVERHAVRAVGLDVLRGDDVDGERRLLVVAGGKELRVVSAAEVEHSAAAGVSNVVCEEQI